jgi:excisionase family DNA binding protein
MKVTDMKDELLTTAEAARYVRLGKPTLERFRLSGDGPLYAKLGGAVRYRQVDLDTWVSGRLVKSTSDVR